MIWRFVNSIVIFISKSFLHGLLSRNILILEVIGSKTRKKYLIPVSYYECDDGLLLCVTDRKNLWWKNLRSVERVEVIFKGRPIKASIEIEVENKDIIRSHLKELCVHSRLDGFFANVGYESGQPVQKDLEEAAARMTSIQLRLSGLNS